MNPVTGTGRTSDDANLELVDKLCYLGDMLSVDGDADAAVETRIRIGWNKLVGNWYQASISNCFSRYLHLNMLTDGHTHGQK